MIDFWQLRANNEATKILNLSEVPDIAAWDAVSAMLSFKRAAGCEVPCCSLQSLLSTVQRGAMLTVLCPGWLVIKADYGNRSWDEIGEIRSLFQMARHVIFLCLAKPQDIGDSIEAIKKLITSCQLKVLELPNDSAVRLMTLNERWDNEGRERASQYLRAMVRRTHPPNAHRPTTFQGTSAYHKLYRNHDNKHHDPFDSFRREVNEYSIFMKDYSYPRPIEFW
ncbi:hypothetical protein SISNIDRAFT_470958 [Sistotremastrum niveocremeum HHB9708]|uniref:Uncharacterized protein n=1 Tax=Sistotremastrum niveocremeum HHB9708 TaxID=1314777 RepID=A0A164N5Y1_9AGAM|nr:hypothetical protein SISNIDRAFT_470958 [Sistotremastrum niveocremeum HHB9708]